MPYRHRYRWPADRGQVHEADIQDRDGAPDLLASTAISHPWLSHIPADGGYGGGKRRGTLDKTGGWTIEIIRRSDTAKGFGLLPRRPGGVACLRLAGTLSPSGKGCRGDHRQHPPHDQAVGKSLISGQSS